MHLQVYRWPLFRSAMCALGRYVGVGRGRVVGTGIGSKGGKVNYPVCRDMLGIVVEN